MSNPARAYLSTQVETTTQGELLLMLYEAAIKFLKRAKIEIEKKDYAQKGIYISKAMDVIGELADSLNKDKGGEITENLCSLYMFCNIHLAKANIRMDTQKIDEVIKIISGIHAAYAQVVPQVEKGAAAAGAKRTTASAAQATPTAPVQPVQSAPAQQAEQKGKPSAPKPENKHQAAPAESTPEPKQEAKPGQPAPEKQQGKPTGQAAPTAPKPMLNPTRLRATNAYSNSR